MYTLSVRRSVAALRPDPPRATRCTTTDANAIASASSSGDISFSSSTASGDTPLSSSVSSPYTLNTRNEDRDTVFDS